MTDLVHPESDHATNEHDIEPCCEGCRHEIDKAPHLAPLIKERCLFGTRVTDDQGQNALSWD